MPSFHRVARLKKKKKGEVRRDASKSAHPRLAGIELYFDDLEAATRFYGDCLGLPLRNEQQGHHAHFDGGAGFICLERKGAENYPSSDKAVVFLDVPDLDAAIARIGRERIVHFESNGLGSRPAWAALHDPEGHNILLLGKKSRTARR